MTPRAARSATDEDACAPANYFPVALAGFRIADEKVDGDLISVYLAEYIQQPCLHAAPVRARDNFQHF